MALQKRQGIIIIRGLASAVEQPVLDVLFRVAVSAQPRPKHSIQIYLYWRTT